MYFTCTAVASPVAEHEHAVQTCTHKGLEVLQDLCHVTGESSFLCKETIRLALTPELNNQHLADSFLRILLPSTTTFSMSNYHLEKSILFVGYAWRTDLFSIHRNITGEISRQISWKAELTNRLSQVSLPSQTKALLLEIVAPIDHFEWKLGMTPKVAHSLGLGDRRPAVPYEDIKSQKIAEVSQVFIRAVTLDRILWALGIGTLSPCIQYIHNDFDSIAPLTPLDMSHFSERLVLMEQHLKVMNEDNDNIGYPTSSSLGNKLLCAITSVKHEAAGTFHTVTSHLYYVATVMLLLLVSEGKRSPEEVESTFKSVVPFHVIGLEFRIVSSCLIL